MVEYMDKLIGRLVNKVDSLGLRDQTLIVFVGDNGTGKGTRSKMGDRVVIGGKGTTTSTGMHVPLIVNWPGQVPPKVHSTLVDSTDFLPTLLDAAAVPAPENLILDGHSLMPHLRGHPGQVRDWIYSWYSPRQGADKSVREFVFNQHYKLYRTGEFFDLDHDPQEKSPLKVATLTGEARDAAKDMQTALDEYRDARPPELDR
jgi:arylsulfatase A